MEASERDLETKFVLESKRCRCIFDRLLSAYQAVVGWRSSKSCDHLLCEGFACTARSERFRRYPRRGRWRLLHNRGTRQEGHVYPAERSCDDLLLRGCVG